MKVIKLKETRVVWTHEGQIRNEDDAGERCNHEFLGNDTSSPGGYKVCGIGE